MLKAVSVLSIVGTASACTIIAVGKVAGGGSTYLAHTDDAGGGTQDVRLVRVPAADWPEGSVRNVYTTKYAYPRLIVNERGPGYEPNAEKDETTLSVAIGSIPQVPHTYAYWDTDYGVMNEKSLAIAESTCGARTAGWSLADSPEGAEPGHNLWGIDELTRVALERCDTAKCAIQTMGSLAEESGFYSNAVGTREAPLYEDSAECLGISDKDGEIWLFHVMTGIEGKSAVWVAQRVPDTDVSVTANGQSVRDVTVSDTDNFLIAKDAVENAKKIGWWVPGRTHGSDIDFTATYGPVLDFSNGPPLSVLYVGRRVWRVLDLFAPSLNLDPRLGMVPSVETYPFSVTAEKQVNIEDVFNTLRDYFQGTEFDLSKGPFSGPFHTPARYDVPMAIRNQLGPGGFERSISTYRTTFSFVCVTRPHLPYSIGGQLWYSQDSPWGSTYVPLYGSQEEIHESYMSGHQAKYDPNSAYWIFNFLNNWAQLRFNVIQPEMMKKAVAFESSALKSMEENEKDLIEQYLSSDDHESKAQVLKQLEQWSLGIMTQVIEGWKSLTYELIARYHNGWFTHFEGDNSGKPEPYGPGPAVSTLGYDPVWLKSVGWNSWPGDTYKAVVIPSEVQQDTDTMPAESSSDSPSSASAVQAAGASQWYNNTFMLFLLGGICLLSFYAWKAATKQLFGPTRGSISGYANIDDSSNKETEIPQMVHIDINAAGGVPKYTRAVV